MTAMHVVDALVLWAGATLILAETVLRTRPPLVERIGRYLPGAWHHDDAWTAAGSSAATRRAARAAVALADRGAHLLGLGADLDRRLERTHSTLDAPAVRLRQLGAGGAALLVAVAVASRTWLPPEGTLAIVLLAPLTAFTAVDHAVTIASQRWQRDVFVELPVICEHLAMLLGAGYSLGGALDRIAQRSDGSCGRDLARVVQRANQGLGEHAALAEWAALAEVPAVERLVATLSLDRQAGDLGRLISEESRAVRAEARRVLAEDIARRAQQVWIPVTVASLVPGTILVGIPFLQAIQMFSRS